MGRRERLGGAPGFGVAVVIAVLTEENEAGGTVKLAAPLVMVYPVDGEMISWEGRENVTT